MIGFDDTTAGILIGATIHDVAQVVGAGFALSDDAGEVATYVKLLRVACLPIVILTIAFVIRAKDKSGAAKTFPWFAVAFVVILITNSLGFIPVFLVNFLDWIAQWLLIGAIAALGVKTSLKDMISLGPTHFGLVVAETVILFVLAVGAILFMQS